MFKRLKNILLPKASKKMASPLPSPDVDSLLINAYCTKGTVPELNFPCTLNNRRDLSDPELFPHLSGFVGYVRSRGNNEMSRAKYHVIRHIQRTQQHLSFSVEENQMDAVADWAERANALLFLPDGNVRDAQGRVLVSAIDGNSDQDAEIPYPVEAWERKARTEKFLATKNLGLPLHLPPLVSETELRLRDPQEIVGRALALFVVAVRAESLATNDPIAIPQLEERFPLAFTCLTENERSFLFAENPTSNEVIQFAWRYECLFLLEWVLGLVEFLPYPGAICDVPLAARIITTVDENTLFKTATMRPASEILDSLDLHYRLHWLVRQARHNNGEIPADCEGGVIQERHYALNWLVRFEESEWDDVDTPT
jgi:Domain of unknown function (DUF4272)